MSSKLPYVNQPGSMVKILKKIMEAKTPDRFTQDFLQTKLGFRGGNYQQFIPLAKKLALLNTDGSPTDLYKAFRNSATSGPAIAEALKRGYRELFDRNEYANDLKKEDLKGLVVEITGLEPKNRVVQLTCQTFEHLSKLADFGKPLLESEGREGADEEGHGTSDDKDKSKVFDLNLSYAINLVLPKTDDPAVFNAIFRSLRDNLLRK